MVSSMWNPSLHFPRFPPAAIRPRFPDEDQKKGNPARRQTCKGSSPSLISEMESAPKVEPAGGELAIQGSLARLRPLLSVLWLRLGLGFWLFSLSALDVAPGQWICIINLNIAFYYYLPGCRRAK